MRQPIETTDYKTCESCADILSHGFTDASTDPAEHDKAVSKANAHLGTGEWWGDGEYYSLKWFKNGNAHLTFLRLDLVDQLNKILVRHHPNALPAAR